MGGPTVDEIHIDFLLEEEFNAEKEFLQRFIQFAVKNVDSAVASKTLQQTCAADLEVSVSNVLHSVFDVSGEADLIVICEVKSTPTQRVAILIENKINAIFQHLQPERYTDRGERGINEAKWDGYWTCLVAPAKYIHAGHKFDTHVELEQIKDWFLTGKTSRAKFKAEVINKAIQKQSIRGTKLVDDVMSAFRRSHYALWEEHFKAQCAVAELSRLDQVWRGESWIRYKLTEPFHSGTYIEHKSERGLVDLTFKDTDAKKLSDITSLLEHGMSIEQTSKSAAIRLEVEPILDFANFESGRENILSSFKAIERLIAFYKRNQSQLDPILQGARRLALPI